MSYTPLKEHMIPLGFSSTEKEKSLYKVWTNSLNNRQIRSHRNTGSTWLDFYERASLAAPWAKRLAGPSLPTYSDFYQQLQELGWLA